MVAKMRESAAAAFTLEQKNIEERKTEATRRVKMGYSKIYREIERLERENYEQINTFFKK